MRRWSDNAQTSVQADDHLPINMVHRPLNQSAKQDSRACAWSSMARQQGCPSPSAHFSSLASTARGQAEANQEQADPMNALMKMSMTPSLRACPPPVPSPTFTRCTRSSIDGPGAAEFQAGTSSSTGIKTGEERMQLKHQIGALFRHLEQQQQQLASATAVLLKLQAGDATQGGEIACNLPRSERNSSVNCSHVSTSDASNTGTAYLFPPTPPAFYEQRNSAVELNNLSTLRTSIPGDVSNTTSLAPGLHHKHPTINSSSKETSREQTNNSQCHNHHLFQVAHSNPHHSSQSLRRPCNHRASQRGHTVMSIEEWDDYQDQWDAAQPTDASHIRFIDTDAGKHCASQRSTSQFHPYTAQDHEIQKTPCRSYFDFQDADWSWEQGVVEEPQRQEMPLCWSNEAGSQPRDPSPPDMDATGQEWVGTTTHLLAYPPQPFRQPGQSYDSVHVAQQRAKSPRYQISASNPAASSRCLEEEALEKLDEALAMLQDAQEQLLSEHNLRQQAEAGCWQLSHRVSELEAQKMAVALRLKEIQSQMQHAKTAEREKAAAEADILKQEAAKAKQEAAKVKQEAVKVKQERLDQMQAKEAQCAVLEAQVRVLHQHLSLQAAAHQQQVLELQERLWEHEARQPAAELQVVALKQHSQEQARLHHRLQTELQQQVDMEIGARESAERDLHQTRQRLLQTVEDMEACNDKIVAGSLVLEQRAIEAEQQLSVMQAELETRVDALASKTWDTELEMKHFEDTVCELQQQLEEELERRLHAEKMLQQTSDQLQDVDARWQLELKRRLLAEEELQNSHLQLAEVQHKLEDEREQYWCDKAHLQQASNLLAETEQQLVSARQQLEFGMSQAETARESLHAGLDHLKPRVLALESELNVAQQDLAAAELLQSKAHDEESVREAVSKSELTMWQDKRDTVQQHALQLQAVMQQQQLEHGELLIGIAAEQQQMQQHASKCAAPCAQHTSNTHIAELGTAAASQAEAELAQIVDAKHGATKMELEATIGRLENEATPHAALQKEHQCLQEQLRALHKQGRESKLQLNAKSSQVEQDVAALELLGDLQEELILEHNQARAAAEHVAEHALKQAQHSMSNFQHHLLTDAEGPMLMAELPSASLPELCQEFYETIAEPDCMPKEENHSMWETVKKLQETKVKQVQTLLEARMQVEELESVVQCQKADLRALQQECSQIPILQQQVKHWQQACEQQVADCEQHEAALKSALQNEAALQAALQNATEMHQEEVHLRVTAEESTQEHIQLMEIAVCLRQAAEEALQEQKQLAEREMCLRTTAEATAALQQQQIVMLQQQLHDLAADMTRQVEASTLTSTTDQAELQELAQELGRMRQQVVAMAEQQQLNEQMKARWKEDMLVHKNAHMEMARLQQRLCSLTQLLQMPCCRHECKRRCHNDDKEPCIIGPFPAVPERAVCGIRSVEAEEIIYSGWQRSLKLRDRNAAEFDNRNATRFADRNATEFEVRNAAGTPRTMLKGSHEGMSEEDQLACEHTLSHDNVQTGTAADGRDVAPGASQDYLFLKLETLEMSNAAPCSSLSQLSSQYSGLLVENMELNQQLMHGSPDGSCPDRTGCQQLHFKATLQLEASSNGKQDAEGTLDADAALVPSQCSRLASPTCKNDYSPYTLQATSSSKMDSATSWMQIPGTPAFSHSSHVFYPQFHQAPVSGDTKEALTQALIKALTCATHAEQQLSTLLSDKQRAERQLAALCGERDWLLARATCELSTEVMYQLRAQQQCGRDTGDVGRRPSCSSLLTELSGVPKHGWQEDAVELVQQSDLQVGKHAPCEHGGKQGMCGGAANGAGEWEASHTPEPLHEHAVLLDGSSLGSSGSNPPSAYAEFDMTYSHPPASVFPAMNDVSEDDALSAQDAVRPVRCSTAAAGCAELHRCSGISKQDFSNGQARALATSHIAALAFPSSSRPGSPLVRLSRRDATHPAATRISSTSSSPTSFGTGSVNGGATTPPSNVEYAGRSLDAEDPIMAAQLMSVQHQLSTLQQHAHHLQAGLDERLAELQELRAECFTQEGEIIRLVGALSEERCLKERLRDQLALQELLLACREAEVQAEQCRCSELGLALAYGQAENALEVVLAFELAENTLASVGCSAALGWPAWEDAAGPRAGPLDGCRLQPPSDLCLKSEARLGSRLPPPSDSALKSEVRSPSSKLDQAAVKPSSASLTCDLGVSFGLNSDATPSLGLTSESKSVSSMVFNPWSQAESSPAFPEAGEADMQPSLVTNSTCLGGADMQWLCITDHLVACLQAMDAASSAAWSHWGTLQCLIAPAYVMHPQQLVIPGERVLRFTTCLLDLLDHLSVLQATQQHHDFLLAVNRSTAGSAQVCPAQTGTTQTGLAQTSSQQTRPTPTGPTQVAPAHAILSISQNFLSLLVKNMGSDEKVWPASGTVGGVCGFVPHLPRKLCRPAACAAFPRCARVNPEVKLRAAEGSQAEDACYKANQASNSWFKCAPTFPLGGQDVAWDDMDARWFSNPVTAFSGSAAPSLSLSPSMDVPNLAPLSQGAHHVHNASSTPVHFTQAGDSNQASSQADIGDIGTDGVHAIDGGFGASGTTGIAGRITAGGTSGISAGEHTVDGGSGTSGPIAMGVSRSRSLLPEGMMGHSVSTFSQTSSIPADATLSALVPLPCCASSCSSSHASDVLLPLPPTRKAGQLSQVYTAGPLSPANAFVDPPTFNSWDVLGTVHTEAYSTLRLSESELGDDVALADMPSASYLEGWLNQEGTAWGCSNCAGLRQRFHAAEWSNAQLALQVEQLQSETKEVLAVKEQAVVGLAMSESEATCLLQRAEMELRVLAHQSTPRNSSPDMHKLQALLQDMQHYLTGNDGAVQEPCSVAMDS